MSYKLIKSGTGIEGLDSVLLGGIPTGRTTLLMGKPGTGKTILSMQYLINRAENNEPGIFISFEETENSLRHNASSFGWDLNKFEKENKIRLVDAKPDPNVKLTGDFNFSGLIALIEGIANKLNARHIVIDAIDMVLQMLDDPALERNQLYLLHEWLLDKKLTVFLTSKIFEDTSGYPFMEYLTDCVIALDRNNRDRLMEFQVLKFRGSDFITGKHPYTISSEGFRAFPISDPEFDYRAFGEHISTGFPELDSMMTGGYRRESRIVIAGSSGTGKTTFANKFASSACERGERVLYINYEESADNMIAMMRSVGIDLNPHIKKGNLKILSQIPESTGPMNHLDLDLKIINAHDPQYLILDAASACEGMGSEQAASFYLNRLLHYCRKRHITVMIIHQNTGSKGFHKIYDIGYSSKVDTILFLDFDQIGGEVNRTVLVLKSRGSGHSNQYREFIITSEGINFIDIYGGKGGMLTGTARLEQENKERLEILLQEERIQSKKKEVNHLRDRLESEMQQSRTMLLQAEADLAYLESQHKMAVESEKNRINWRERETTEHRKKK